MINIELLAFVIPNSLTLSLAQLTRPANLSALPDAAHPLFGTITSWWKPIRLMTLRNAICERGVRDTISDKANTSHIQIARRRCDHPIDYRVFACRVRAKRRRQKRPFLAVVQVHLELTATLTHKSMPHRCHPQDKRTYRHGPPISLYSFNQLLSHFFHTTPLLVSSVYYTPVYYVFNSTVGESTNVLHKNHRFTSQHHPQSASRLRISTILISYIYTKFSYKHHIRRLLRAVRNFRDLFVLLMYVCVYVIICNLQ